MPEERKPPACVAPGGICPVSGCADDGACYLAQCRATAPDALALLRADDELRRFADLALTVLAARGVS